MAATGTGIVYAFGAFRVDPDKQLILRDEQPIAVTPKVFETLLILVRRNGEVVTRGELMHELWPDSFVEDSNLSQNIFMLRKALGDTSEGPRHIVTVPGRGYRFTADVRQVHPREEAIVITGHTRSQVIVEQTEEEPNQAAENPLALSGRRRVGKKRRFALVTIFVAGLAAAGGLLWQRLHRSASFDANGAVFIADFSNATGDPVFEDTLRQGLLIQLQQSPFLSLIPENRIRRTLHMMGQSENQPLTPDLAREACTRAGGAAVLYGTIAPLGSEYVVGLRAAACSSGATIDVEQAESASKEGVLKALTQIARRFRSRVGESLATIQEHDTPLDEATTPSLEALKAYSIGHKLMSSAGATQALPFFERAVAIDPHFAIAYALLGRAYGDLGEAALSAQNTAKAFSLRDQTSDAEKFWITAAYNTQVMENMEQAQQTCEVWERTYPHDPTPASFLAGVIYPVLGRYEQGVKEALKALDADPDFFITYAILAGDYESLDRLQDADDTFRRAESRKVEMPELLLAEYDVAFLRGDVQKMDHIFAQARDSQLAYEWITQHGGSVLAYNGHVQMARKAAQNAVNLAQQAGHHEAAALYEAGAAVWEGLFGYPGEARHQADAALKLSTDRGVEYGAAFALALSGQTSRAQQLADDMEKRFPQDTSVKCSYLRALRGEIALNHGNASQALELTASSCELGTPRTAIHANFGAMYPSYVRGQALLALGKGSEAAREFERLVDHPGIVASDPVGALARLEVGRAYAMAGDKNKALAGYAGFLRLWNSADPNIPILKQAEVENRLLLLRFQNL